jgi:hypothetical protein
VQPCDRGIISHMKASMRASYTSILSEEVI